MDLSKKSSPYYRLPLSTPLHQAEQSTPSSSFSMEMKGEYIEEDIIKEESADVHVDAKPYCSPQILSRYQTTHFHPTLPSTSSHFSSHSFTSPPYPPIPPYSSIYSAITHPLANLQSFQQFHSTSLPATKRKT
jgi:hypothetical protein